MSRPTLARDTCRPALLPTLPPLQAAPDAVYQGTLETFESLGRVVESLQSRTAKLTVGA